MAYAHPVERAALIYGFRAVAICEHHHHAGEE
jgi:hypothetical protein